MANAKSTTLQEKVINYVLGNESFTPASTLYLALFTAQFDEDAAPIDDTFALDDEVDPGTTTYERITIPNDTSSWTGSDGTRQNINELEFTEAGESWGTIRAAALLDTCSGGNGSNIYYYGNLPNPKAIDVNDIFRFKANQLTITEN